jgi:hypothetical protein
MHHRQPLWPRIRLPARAPFPDGRLPLWWQPCRPSPSPAPASRASESGCAPPQLPARRTYVRHGPRHPVRRPFRPAETTSPDGAQPLNLDRPGRPGPVKPRDAPGAPARLETSVTLGGVQRSKTALGRVPLPALGTDRARPTWGTGPPPPHAAVGILIRAGYIGACR